MVSGRTKLLLLSVLLLLGVAVGARAATVTYSTQFWNLALTSQLGTIGSGNVTVDFVGQPSVSYNAATNPLADPAYFGQVKLHVNSNNDVDFAQDFRLRLYQTVPGNGNDNWVGDLQGNIDNKAGTLTLGLDNTQPIVFSTTFNGKNYITTYVLDTPQGVLNAQGKGDYTVQISGFIMQTDPAGVPTPAAVWAGLSLLGGLTVARIRRNRASL